MAQTDGDWELVVVDNGNSDEMARVVRRTPGSAHHTCAAREQGHPAVASPPQPRAVGRYVCAWTATTVGSRTSASVSAPLVDADPGIDAVACDAELFRDPDDGSPPTGWFEGWSSVPDPSRAMTLTDMLNDGVPLYLGAFRREIWDSLDAYVPSADDVEPDIELWLRLAAAGRDIRVLPEKLARVRVRSTSSSRDAARIEEFENNYQKAFLAVSNHYPISEDVVSSGGMMRRLRYIQALRKARWALLDGDIPQARVLARDAYHQRRTLHAAAIIVALRLSPGVLRSIHPVKNRVQSVLSRARFRIATSRT